VLSDLIVVTCTPCPIVELMAVINDCTAPVCAAILLVLAVGTPGPDSPCAAVVTPLSLFIPVPLVVELGAFWGVFELH
jgi:hypothetical protein